MTTAPNGGPAAGCHPRVGVGVLLVDEHGRVLLTLRKLAPEAGCWSIVGASWIIWRHFKNARFAKLARKSVWMCLLKPFFASQTISCPGKPALGFPRLLRARTRGRSQKLRASENEPRHVVPLC